ncbi:putative short-chain dehydrogenase/reductase [Nocardioides phosphati]|uniref:Short-chain dehydrogenase/reductase n=1 Tax=Nocardioides phosphati TaxID=1867775 RepID=A0ABQ2NGL5_9ACTN|nr:putative short-chain dehydrogenase/reductase [Nocardioides phosphati]
MARSVAITGGAQGIGRAVAEALLADGHRVVIGDIDLELARATAAALGGGARAAYVDVRDPASFAAFLDEADTLPGGLEVLVNNAGIMPIGDFLDESDALTDRAIDIDLRGVLTGTKLAGRRFRQRGAGHVVNIASVMGTLASPNAATYCAAKYGVVGLGHALRQEWRGSGVTISTICPGFVRTGLIAGMSAPRGTGWLLMVDPEDVARAVVKAVRRNRSRTVFVPRGVGEASRGSNALPDGVRDWMFRASGGNKVTTDLDRDARADYQRTMEGRR